MKRLRIIDRVDVLQGRLHGGGVKMAKLLICQDMDLDCDYICAETEEDLLNRAIQYARLDQSRTEIPSEFQDRVLSLSRNIDRC